LGNSRAVCRKYYIHPGLIQLYEENKLFDYFTESDGHSGDAPHFSAAESIMMKILKMYINQPASCEKDHKAKAITQEV
jgi:DNA topoisomerase I